MGYFSELDIARQESKIQVTFKKISKPNKIFSVWQVFINNQLTKYEILGEQHPQLKNVYTVLDTVNNSRKFVGSLATSKSWILNFIIKGN